MRRIPLRGLILATLLLSWTSLPLSADDRKQSGLVALFRSSPEFADKSNFIGTGFVIDDYWLVTARHVIEQTTTGAYSRQKPNLTVRPLNPLSNDSVGFVPGSLKCPMHETGAVDVCFIKLVSSEARNDGLRPFTEFGCEISKGQAIEVHGFLADAAVNDLNGTVKSTSGSKAIKYVDTGNELEHTSLAISTFASAGGISGSPIFRQGTDVVIGVHNGRDGDFKYFTPLYYVDGVSLSPDAAHYFTCLGNAGALEAGSRTVSYVMRYGPEGSPFEAEEEVRRIIRNGISHIRTLAKDNASGQTAREHIEKIRVLATNDAVEGYAHLQSLHNEADRSILQILYGELVATGEASAPYSIDSTIYLGGLANEAGYVGMSDEFDISASGRIRDFRKTADGHQLVMLYAMILEAKRTEQPDHLVLGLLAVSDSVRDSLDARGHLVGDLVEISTILEHMKSEYGF